MTSHTSYILARTAPAAPGGVEYFTGLCDLVFAKPTNWLRPHVSVLLDEAKRYEAATALNASMTLVKHSERPDGCGDWHALPVALHLPGYEPPPQAETAPVQPWQPQKKSAEERAHRRADVDRRHREQLQQSIQLLDDLHAALCRRREAERRAPDARGEAPAPVQPCQPLELCLPGYVLLPYRAQEKSPAERALGRAARTHAETVDLRAYCTTPEAEAPDAETDHLRTAVEGLDRVARARKIWAEEYVRYEFDPVSRTLVQKRLREDF